MQTRKTPIHKFFLLLLFKKIDKYPQLPTFNVQRETLSQTRKHLIPK